MANNSINTNVGAQLALQVLNSTNRDLAATQNRISSGLKVSSAKDNGAIYAIAQKQRADVAAYGAVAQSLGRNKSVVDVALSAVDQVTDKLKDAKATLIALTDSSTSTENETSLGADYTDILAQIDDIVSGAAFDGINVLKASNDLKVRTNVDSATAVTIDFTSADTDSATLGLTAGNATKANAETELAAVDAALTTINTRAASLGRISSRFDSQLDFNSKIVDALNQGIGQLVDADLAEESAKLTALQTKQQLGVQALSVANSAPNAILSLFR